MKISSFNKISFQSGLRVIASDLSKNPTKKNFDIYGKRIYPHYVLSYIVQGNGYYATEKFGKLCVKDGDLVFIPPRVCHQFGPVPGTVWSEYWMSFDGFIADHFYETKNIFSDSPVIHLDKNRILLNKFKIIFRLIRLIPAPHTALARHLYDILMFLLEGNFFTPDDRYNAEIQRIIRSIEQEHTKPLINFSDITEKSQYSASYLSKIFKKQTGYTPAEYFKIVKIRKAGDLILNTNMRIKEIAKYLNFSDPYHFSHVFTKIIGKSPQQWRNMYKSR
ncbi:MAG: hypothetical protein A2096_02170 [Spirochaetes bacterium GWF1_41_5]|nr:MAG: hypothetical protein A2096_02170 [Spirochaetes bacterium GWF1_41_5]HBE04029.1 hypothetical protein [Spirochaetia bacterium]